MSKNKYRLVQSDKTGIYKFEQRMGSTSAWYWLPMSIVCSDDLQENLKKLEELNSLETWTVIA